MAKSKAKATPEELANRKARTAEKKEREAAEFKADLTRDLELAKSALADVEKQSQTAREDASMFKALVSHLAGFYQEVDKLSKNKGVFEATDLVVQTINDVVRDAKHFATGDPYLDRTKEFVPAGQNPPYSDVLMVARTVQQFLQRSEQGILERGKQLARMSHHAQTIIAALSWWIENDDQPTKDDVAEGMTGKPSEAWFFEAENGEWYFNHERLKQRGVQESLSVD
jgi:hypothetical protein